MHSYECNLYCTTYLSVSNLEQAGICEKYNNPKTKELIKIRCYRCNSHVGSAVSYFPQLYFIAVHKVFVSRLICSLMTSSATSRRRLDFHHIKVDFKKSEVVQPLLHTALKHYESTCSGDVQGFCFKTS